MCIRDSFSGIRGFNGLRAAISMDYERSTDTRDGDTGFETLADHSVDLMAEEFHPTSGIRDMNMLRERKFYYFHTYSISNKLFRIKILNVFVLSAYVTYPKFMVSILQHF